MQQIEFQLTHSRGVRLYFFSSSGTETADFNSRTHVECDLSASLGIPRKRISTHALTWSATSVYGRKPCPWQNFNSRTHVECDCGCQIGKRKEVDFNSRTHVECDNRCRLSRQRKIISTHALTWSATQLYYWHLADQIISTHALTWSAT